MTKILVVDDDAAVRRLVRDVLEIEGYDVSEAPDGPQALQAVAESRPDCVILDVMMPGLNGHDVLARIRENDSANGLPALPVVMLTAAADDAQAWRAWTGGVDYFLAKPFDAAQLLRFLTHLFNEAPTEPPS